MVLTATIREGFIIIYKWAAEDWIVFSRSRESWVKVFISEFAFVHLKTRPHSSRPYLASLIHWVVHGHGMPEFWRCNKVWNEASGLHCHSGSWTNFKKSKRIRQKRAQGLAHGERRSRRVRLDDNVWGKCTRASGHVPEPKCELEYILVNQGRSIVLVPT